VKIRIIIVVAALGAAAGLAPLYTGCGKNTQEHGEAKATQYHCPMHPTIVSDKPGDCPICGMRLVPLDEGGETAPEVASASTVPGLAVISITPQSRQVMGLELGTVEKRQLAHEVRTSARIDADETRLHHVTMKVDGWVNDLFVSITGQEVKHGDPLLTIYSPDLVSAQREYLTALETRDKLTASSLEDARRSADDLVAAARQRLEFWDVSEEQIARVEETRQVEKYVTLYAHGSGVVTERNIAAGHKLTAGEVLMTIADLSMVWGDADIYQSDLPYVKVGMPLEMSLPYWPGKKFRGKVIFISPTLDPATRTLRARLEIPNPELLLKPGMYGDASLFYQLGEMLSIPIEAVMSSGRHAYAFKDTGDGHLVPTLIKVGARGNGMYELLDGLKEGDRIVVSANFLVDSESNLKAALDAMTGGDSVPQPADAHQGHQQ
jgi:Cu(I)/Ag(I) efflux system membrane fusion protein